MNRTRFIETEPIPLPEQAKIEVKPVSYINLNQVAHHERLRNLSLRHGKMVSPSEVYDQYIDAYSEFLEKNYEGTKLQVVEAMVSFPPATKNRESGAFLTPGANAYIIQKSGLANIVVKNVL